MKSKQTESKYRSYLIEQLKSLFPGCVILKNDPSTHQGIPDLTILFGDRWAMLEVKTHCGAVHRPNQDFWVTYLNEMSYASFIYPENEEAVIRELQSTFSH